MPLPLQRFIAFLIDLCIFCLYLGLLVGVSLLCLSDFLVSLAPGIFQSALAFDALSFLLVILPLLLYFSLLEQSSWRGTLGKRLLGLRVTDLEGRKLGASKAFLRNSLRFLPWQLAHTAVFQIMLGSQHWQTLFFALSIIAQLTVFVYIVTILLSKEQALYDRLVDTRVVKAGT